MPEQVAVGTRIEQRLIALARPLAHRKRHRAIGMSALDTLDAGREPLVGKPRIFPALQHERAKPEVVSFIGALHDYIWFQPVTCAFRV